MLDMRERQGNTSYGGLVTDRDGAEWEGLCQGYRGLESRGGEAGVYPGSRLAGSGICLWSDMYGIYYQKLRKYNSATNGGAFNKVMFLDCVRGFWDSATFLYLNL